MLAIEVDFLTGRYVATTFNDRTLPEWPPHPARLYSALVASWADADDPDPSERAVLEWLETLGPPEIWCSDARARSRTDAFVPVNDVTVVGDKWRSYAAIMEASEHLRSLDAEVGTPAHSRAATRVDRAVAKAKAEVAKAGSAKVTETPGVVEEGVKLLPELRGRQARTYPTMVPDDPIVHLVWPDISRSSEVDLLDTILSRVSRLGHSSSLVSCRLVEALPEPGRSYVPDERGPVQIRVMAPGLLSALEVEYARHRGSEPRTLPAVFQSYKLRYAQEDAVVPTSVMSGEWIVLQRSSHRRLSLRDTLVVTRAVRDALVHHAKDPVPEIISGHVADPGGARPTQPAGQPHLAVVPLANVANPHADGAVLGVALVLPAATSSDDREAVYAALERWQEAGDGDNLPLFLGRGGVVMLRRVVGASPRQTLTRMRWCRPARVWASVTPIALDRHPGDLHDRRSDRRAKAMERAIATIQHACRYGGLPDPEGVEIRLDSPIPQVPSPLGFAPYRARSSGQGRFQVHARLRFGEPVPGPILIGAGRYLGYGLCAPVPEQELTGGAHPAYSIGVA